jgi:hypothetical protein
MMSVELKSVFVTTEGKEGVVVMHLEFVGRILMDPCLSETCLLKWDALLHFAGQHL